MSAVSFGTHDKPVSIDGRHFPVVLARVGRHCDPTAVKRVEQKNYLFNVVIIYVCYTTYYSLGRLPGYSGSRQLPGVGCQKRQPSLMADLLSARMSRPGLKFSSNHIRGILQKMAIGMLDIQYDTNWLPFLKNGTGMQLLTADIIYDTTVLW